MKLLPCPFCGTKPTGPYLADPGLPTEHVSIACCTCRFKLESTRYVEHASNLAAFERMAATKAATDAVVKRWNTRR